MTTTNEQRADWRRQADEATPGEWAAGWDLEPTDDYRDLGITAYNQGGVVSAMFVCETCHSNTIGQAIKNANFIAAARTAVPALLDDVDELNSERDALDALLTMSQAKRYELEARLTAAEAEAGRLRERATVLFDMYSEHIHDHRLGTGKTCDGCRKLTEKEVERRLALAPVTEPQAAQAGERERVAEAMIEWAADADNAITLDEHYYVCDFCKGMANNVHDFSVTHAPDCLHLRAKALRADEGGSGEGGG